MKETTVNVSQQNSMPNPLARAVTEALLRKAAPFVEGAPCETTPGYMIALIADLATALRAAHAALDGATVHPITGNTLVAASEEICTRLKGEDWDDDDRATIHEAMLRVLHERVTVTRALPEDTPDAR